MSIFDRKSERVNAKDNILTAIKRIFRFLSTHLPKCLLYSFIVAMFSLPFVFSISPEFFPKWVGLTEDEPPTGSSITSVVIYEQAKDLWDWLELLLVPSVLVIVAYLFNRSENHYALELQDRREKEVRFLEEQRIAETRHIEEQKVQDSILQVYIDQITQLLLHDNLRKSEEGAVARVVARSRTITVLDQLAANRKPRIVQFLYEAGLLSDITSSTIDFSGANLRDIDLRGANLRGVILRGADMRCANLQKADLRWADLRGVKLDGANLKNTNLFRANLQRASMTESKLIGANLIEVDMSLAMCSRADLHFALLHGAVLQGTIFAKANLQSADLQNAILMSADFEYANLSYAQLTNANLQAAILRKADLSHADMTRVYLRGAALQQALFEATNLSSAYIAGIALEGVNFRNANRNSATETDIVGDIEKFLLNSPKQTSNGTFGRSAKRSSLFRLPKGRFVRKSRRRPKK